MGAEPWEYFVPYQNDVNRALQDLRKREFEAGRYNPVQPFPSPPEMGVAPGAQHASIEEAIDAAGADGTRSILDMQRVASDPDDVDFGVVAPVPADVLQEMLGTDRPTREMVQDCPELLEGVERGQGIYVIVHKDGKPGEIYFGGYSYD